MPYKGPSAAEVPAAIFANYDGDAEEASELLRNGGRLISVMSARQAQKMAVFLLGKAQQLAILTAFTFDLLMICEALNEAAARGVQVKVYMDGKHSLAGTTAMQMDRLDQLRSHGVEVYLCTGASKAFNTAKVFL